MGDLIGPEEDAGNDQKVKLNRESWSRPCHGGSVSVGEKMLALSNVKALAFKQNESAVSDTLPPSQKRRKVTRAVRGGQDSQPLAHVTPRRLWVPAAEGSDSHETHPFVTFLPRRPAKWHRLVGIRVREYERRKTSFPLWPEHETVTPA